jgi:hypothetical protein
MTGLLVKALEECPQRVTGDELYEICGQGGERELCDLLRHAFNRTSRPTFMAQREKSIPGLVSRTYMVVWEGHDRSRPAGVQAGVVRAEDHRQDHAAAAVDDRWLCLVHARRATVRSDSVVVGQRLVRSRH